MLWGGLKPIKRQFIFDCVTLGVLAHSSLIPCSNRHKTILVVTCIITTITVGWTKRWTISLPMVPIVLLQTLRYFITIDDHGDSWLVYSIKAFSLLFIGKSLLLTILFPALKISNIKGKYNVGIVDLHLPVDNFVQNYVHVRFLYPTLEKSTRIPYLDTDMGAKICKTLIEIGAPPPLNKLGFLLNHWRLSTVQGKRNANPFVPIRENDESGSKLLPIVVYSHGLTASAELYSYQTMSLAANGAFVMSITHSDASAIAVKRKDGSFLGYDPHIANLAKEKETLLESVRSRRRQVEYRANEVLAAIEALLELSKRNIQELNDVGISFVNKLDVKDITMMGHSFGGATALSVANMRPDLFTCCVAHDPAVDWCTDDCRKSLFSKDRFVGSELTYQGGTGGISNYDSDDVDIPNIHDLDLYFLYSHEWEKLGWGHYNYVRDLFKRGKLGKTNGPTDVTFVFGSKHAEFSDSCMKLPLWLARAVGMTGLRNPHETSKEIFDRTFYFIDQVREKRIFKSKQE